MFGFTLLFLHFALFVIFVVGCCGFHAFYQRQSFSSCWVPESQFSRLNSGDFLRFEKYASPYKTWQGVLTFSDPGFAQAIRSGFTVIV